jgi:hypothetical protein
VQRDRGGSAGLMGGKGNKTQPIMQQQQQTFGNTRERERERGVDGGLCCDDYISTTSLFA